MKYFEAALAGCYVAATPIPDIDRFNSPMLRKCKAESEWVIALRQPWILSHTNQETAIRTLEVDISIDRQATRWLEIFSQMQ